MSNVRAVAHRSYRLSISPDSEPELRRVVDFDGRATLDDVHWLILQELKLGDGADHLYAFFMSGRYWDKHTEYVDPRSDGRRADKALLFRLGLRVGMRFVYLFDFGSEERCSIEVVAINDLAAPLNQPVVVESVGQVSSRREPDRNAVPEEALAELIPLAEAIFTHDDALVEFGPENDEEAEDFTLPEAARPSLRQLGAAALELARAIREDLPLLGALDEWSDAALLATVLELPVTLASAGEVELGLRVAEAFAFCARDELNGDIALILAREGRREEALARLALNLEAATYPYVAEGRAGDVYRALGEDDAAEAYYRRSHAVAQSSSERHEAALRVTNLMLETGREAEASAFVRELAGEDDSEADASTFASGVMIEHDSEGEDQAPRPRAVATALSAPSVGRNEPCPCGSGKKYKKCHGANA